MESVSDTCWSTCLCQPQPQQGQEADIQKPLLRCLRAEGLLKKGGLLPTRRFVQRRKCIGGTQISVVFGNFVFQDEVIAKRVPGQFIEQAMVLVQVMTIVGED